MISRGSLVLLCGMLSACERSALPRDQVTASTAEACPSPGEVRVGRSDVDRPECRLRVEEVVRLRGSLNGIAPRRPVTQLRDGSYVTGTHQPGKMARWSSTGDLISVFGEGPGQGPGEFNQAADVAPVTDGGVLIAPGHSLLYEYAPTGELKGTTRTPWPVGTIISVGGRFLAVGNASTGKVPLVFDGGRWSAVGNPFPLTSPPFLAASQATGVWSSELGRYVLRRHAFPSFDVLDSIAPERPWFPGPDTNKGNVYRIHSDESGVIWILSSVPDPDAPDEPFPQVMTSPSEVTRQLIRYRNSVIEGFSEDGRLLVSERFDDHRDAPYPLADELWYRIEGELVPSIVVLTVSLVREVDGPDARR